MVELEAKLEASGSALSDLDGELRAVQMAAEVEGAEAARQRHQLAAADALIARLMDACARSSAASSAASSRGAASGTTASGSAASGDSSGGGAPSTNAAAPVPAASPQSSCGSVAPR